MSEKYVNKIGLQKTVSALKDYVDNKVQSEISTINNQLMNLHNGTGV